MLAHECVVVQIGVGPLDAGDLGLLTRRKRRGGIQAKQVVQESLPAQHFMDSWNTTGERVGGVEERSVAVRDLSSQREQARGNALLGPVVLAFRKKFDRVSRPAGPMTQEAPGEPEPDRSGWAFHFVPGKQVLHDGVIISSVQGYRTGPACFRHGADHIQGLVTVEGSDFDRCDIFDGNEASPEGDGQKVSSHGGLQIKSHQGDFVGNRFAVFDQAVFIEMSHSSERKQTEVIIEVPGQACLGHRLRSRTANACDPDGLAPGRRIAGLCRPCCEFQYGLE